MKQRAALLERIFSRIRKLPNGCWIWTGAKSKGYGVIRIGGRNGHNELVHRIMLGLRSHGRLEPHHTCENPPCIRPSHLVMVTHRENMLLSDSASGLNARKRTCKRGHLLTGSNVLIYKRSGGRGYERICRICRVITNSKWRKAQRG